MDYHLIIFIFLYIFFVFFWISIRKVFEIGIRYILFACDVVYFLVITLFLLDYYNLFSLFYPIMSGDRWFAFLSSLIAAAFGSIISGIILISVTRKQIDEQNISYNNDKRIQNAPVLQYQISDKVYDSNKNYYSDMNIEESNQRFISYGDDSYNIYNLFVSLENIGLNHARNVKVVINDGVNKKNVENKIDDNQSILKQGDKYWFDFIFSYQYKEKRKNIPIKITVFYNDFLNNNYKQEIELSVFPTNQYWPESRGFHLEINSKKIYDEEYLNVSGK